MADVNALLGRIGLRLAQFLAQPRHIHGTAPPTRAGLLLACLQPADVLLVEGNSRFSTAIKYLTQSTWSHAALYIGCLARGDSAEAKPCFIEADVIDGVRLVGVEAFDGFHTRICRPAGLNEAARNDVVQYMLGCVGDQYDLRNVIDLARYLLPTPPVPLRFRRKMLKFGSGDPTRAICSTLIARAFQHVHYPILPLVTVIPAHTPDCPDCVAEIYHAREVSLFVPRDFDVSPYFEILKPSLVAGFDHRSLQWSKQSSQADC